MAIYDSRARIRGFAHSSRVCKKMMMMALLHCEVLHSMDFHHLGAAAQKPETMRIKAHKFWNFE
jgi:hypothetical protein